MPNESYAADDGGHNQCEARSQHPRRGYRHTFSSRAMATELLHPRLALLLWLTSESLPLSTDQLHRLLLSIGTACWSSGPLAY